MRRVRGDAFPKKFGVVQEAINSIAASLMGLNFAHKSGR